MGGRVTSGILHDLEQHRLRGHGKHTLKTTHALCSELLDLRILPGVVSALLATFAEDVAIADEATPARQP
jgi:hypothetical protein